MPSNEYGVLLAATTLAYQLTFFCWVGDLTSRLLLRSSPTKQGFPEFSFLLGFCVYTLTGYIVLLLTTAAEAVPLAEFTLAGCVALHLSRRKKRPEITESRASRVLDEFKPYLQFRRSWYGKAAILLVLLVCLGVAGSRASWLMQSSHQDTVALGTHIWDDMRTIGFPIALAAHGYPLRSPYAVDVVLPYPIGAFVFTSGHIALLPSLALHFLIADTVAATLFYSFVVLIASAVIVRARIVQFLITASGLISVSYNLFRIDPDVTAAWFEFFYGYTTSSESYTTTGWTPFGGLVWIKNHVLSFSTAVLGILYLTLHQRTNTPLTRPAFIVASVFGLCMAITSMDVTVMSIGAGGLLLTVLTIRSVRATRWRSIPSWVSQLWALLAICSLALVAVNFPTVIGRVDSPFAPPLVFVDRIGYNLGLLLSTVGPYFLVAVAAGLLLWSDVLRAAKFYFIPVAVALGFSLVFRWSWFWVWRASFALHLLFAILCGVLVDYLIYRKKRKSFYLCCSLWAVSLIPGGFQFWHDIRTEPRRAPMVSVQVGEAIRWIYGNTLLADRVVAFKKTENSLTPDVDFLRTGNRAGEKVFDRIHAMVGYQRYRDRMSDLLQGIASNDYILYYEDSPDFAALLDGCGAPIVFQNNSTRIYRIDSNCRSKLRQPDLRDLLAQYHASREHAEALERIVAQHDDPLQLADDVLQAYLINHPEKAQLVRKRAEKFWQAGDFSEAVGFLEPIVLRNPNSAMGNYCLAFSYQMSRLSYDKALFHYNKALELGYSEFWVRYNRGGVYLELRDKEMARVDWLRARELNPDHAGLEGYMKRHLDEP